MNNSKKINVNYSSLVGLKAELLRKHGEVKDAKAKAQTVRAPGPKTKTKKPKEPNLKIPKELVDLEDVKAHQKSKLMLEAKARLYENLKKSHSNKNENFLVDFANKSDESEESIHDSDYDDAPSDPEDDWVEYEDCFGRTRKCLRRDLPRMREKDGLLRRNIMKEPPREPEEPRVSPDNEVSEAQMPSEPAKEPEIEIMRRKWEEQTEKLTRKTDIHYQDVLFDEARAHGVGYYEFSQDEQERAKQQANLSALRKETEQKQREMQELREMRGKMEQNRLKAARIRQRIRAGLPAEEETSEDKAQIVEKKDDEDLQSTKGSDEKSGELEETKTQNSLAVIENKIKMFGELLGKRPRWHEMSQEEWVQKRRKDRLGEFAPVYENFKSVGYLEDGNSRESGTEIGPELPGDWKTCDKFAEGSGRIESGRETEKRIVDLTVSSDSEESDIIGPLPPSLEQRALNVNPDISGIDFSKPPPNIRPLRSEGASSSCPELITPVPVPPVDFTHAVPRVSVIGRYSSDLAPVPVPQINSNNFTNAVPCMSAIGGYSSDLEQITPVPVPQVNSNNFTHAVSRMSTIGGYSSDLEQITPVPVAEVNSSNFTHAVSRMSTIGGYSSDLEQITPVPVAQVNSNNFTNAVPRMSAIGGYSSDLKQITPVPVPQVNSNNFTHAVSRMSTIGGYSSDLEQITPVPVAQVNSNNFTNAVPCMSGIGKGSSDPEQIAPIPAPAVDLSQAVPCMSAIGGYLSDPGQIAPVPVPPVNSNSAAHAASLSNENNISQKMCDDDDNPVVASDERDATKLQAGQHSLDLDKISAGLKYLRNNFEKKDKS